MEVQVVVVVLLVHFHQIMQEVLAILQAHHLLKEIMVELVFQEHQVVEIQEMNQVEVEVVQMQMVLMVQVVLVEMVVQEQHLQ
jgi:hypothetical protein